MITARDKADCAEREVKMRRRVYARWVAEGKMPGRTADREIAVMESIAADYRHQAEAEDAKGRLL